MLNYEKKFKSEKTNLNLRKKSKTVENSNYERKVIKNMQNVGKKERCEKGQSETDSFLHLVNNVYVFILQESTRTLSASSVGRRATCHVAVLIIRKDFMHKVQTQHSSHYI